MISIIPYYNPVVYHELNPQELPQYISKQMEKYPFIDTIERWEQGINYPQLWQKSDIIRQQLKSLFGPVQMQVLDKRGTVVLSTNFQQKIQNVNLPGEWVYENSTELSSFEKGTYFIKLTIGSSSPTILVSEPQFICERIEQSVLLEYRHREYKGGVYFETGYNPSIRVLGRIVYKNPASNDTIYEDQPMNETLVWNTPYDVYTLRIGGSWGIPDYLIKRIARIFGLSYTAIDGMQYTKNGDARWEDKAVDGYVLRGWSIDLRETINREGQIYENSHLQLRQVSAIAAIDTSGFASSDTGNEQLLRDVI